MLPALLAFAVLGCGVWLAAGLRGGGDGGGGMPARLPARRRLEATTPSTPPSSPPVVLWAPWLGSRWLGNLYEYKSGLFNEVMYSNNRPFREGALLYKEKRSLEQIALLYQRYNRFDESSYTVANATYFNLQASSALRLGRYSVPLEDDVVVSVQRPLSAAELDGYLLAPNALKWAFNALLQQIRLRTVRFDQIAGGGGGSGGARGQEGGAGAGRRKEGQTAKSEGGFFRQAVYDIEYAQMDREHSTSGGHVVLGIGPLELLAAGDAADVVSDQQDGLAVPMRVANSQFFLEALFQRVLDRWIEVVGAVACKDCAVLIGGYRGTPMNELACAFLQRILKANGFTDVTLLDFEECDVG